MSTGRLAIRVRVAAAFAVAMALVLTGTGVFLYARLGRDLGTALDEDLRLRAQDLSVLARDPRASLAGASSPRLIEPGESFAQLVTATGRVLDATASLQDRSLLDRRELRAALTGPRFTDRPQVPGLDEGVRLLAIAVRRDGRRRVLVVGATAENRREALRGLRNELLIAGPLALLLATALGYVLAGTGLRAVEAMRARAARISADAPGERLPVPATGDELQRLGITLNDMLDGLEDALERERGFVADAGHELRAPLALMRAELDYALHYAQTEGELRAAIRTASDETDRLIALAGALLLIASSDRGRLTLHADRLAVTELLASVRQRYAWRAKELDRPLVTDEQPAGATVHADRLRLEQALGNLVDNALRHGAGTIELTARLIGDHVELRVSDDGPGFDAAVLPRAFERFSRGPTGRSSGEGAGLGLAIVHAIVNAHDGTVTAANRPGGGAAVRLRLPHARGPQPARQPSAETALRRA